MEIVIVIVVLAIIFSYALPKFSKILDSSNILKLKSDISLIKSALKDIKVDNSLTNVNKIIYLDDARINQKDEKLFSNILNSTAILSTNSIEKKSGYWAKISNSSYIFYLKNKELEFSLVDDDFVCISQDELCEEL